MRIFTLMSAILPAFEARGCTARGLLPNAEKTHPQTILFFSLLHYTVFLAICPPKPLCDKRRRVWQPDFRLSRFRAFCFLR
jgi:hypothetical protein